MPVTLQLPSQPREKESALDKVLKGVQIANGVLGAYSNVQQGRASSQARDIAQAKEADRVKGVVDADTKLQYGDKYSYADQQTPDSIPITSHEGDALRTQYATPRAKQDLLGQMIQGLDLKNKELNITKNNLDIQKTQRELSQPQEFKQNQYQAAGFLNRAQQAETDLGKLVEGGFNPSENTFRRRLDDNWVTAGLGKQSSPVQQYNQAKSNFISAVLRKESGAAIGKDEYTKDDLKYFPQAGDSEDTIAQKAQTRADALTSLKAEAGAAVGQVQGLKVLVDPKKGKDVAAKTDAPKTIHVSDPPAKGYVRVVKGSEVLDIPEKDQADAKKDGYSTVGIRSLTRTR